jgi:signal transduction histidine kinase
VLYSSSDSSLVGGRYGVSDHLARALRGWVVADLSTLDEPEQAPLRSRWNQLLEVYTPVHQESGDGRTIAAVEFYQPPDDLVRQINSSRLQIWMATGGATLLVYLFLAGMVQRGSATIARQQAALGQQVVELEELHGRLRESAGRTTTLNEKALRRIGADLHAGPGQGLALALLRMEVFDHAVDCGCLRAEDLATVRGAVTEAMADLRTISSGLRLPQLEALPLAEVVRRAVSNHERRTGHAVRVEVGAVPEDVPLSVRILLFRTLEEVLANASRHAGGSGLAVLAWPEADGVALVVADDGPGFAPEEACGEAHVGLAYLREQAELLGGRLTIDSAPGHGTRVRVWLPSTI